MRKAEGYQEAGQNTKSRGGNAAISTLRRVFAAAARILRQCCAAAAHGFRRIPWRKVWIGAGCVLAGAVLLLGLTVWRLIATAPSIDASSVAPSEAATWICDADGTPKRKLAQSEANRDIVSLDAIPASLQEAIIAIEDSRFYEHNGIDLRGIARAFRNGILSGSFSEGASTITQQLLKNTVFTDWTQEDSFADRFARKIQEQYLALKLEKLLSKEEILEDYLNTINFGSGCYGVQAAAHRYLGKDVSELTLAESAMLAAIPQNPTGYNPISFPEANRSRQQLVLLYMEEQGYISSQEREAALQENVYASVQAYNETYEADSVYSYYEDALIGQVTEVLTSELNYSSEQAYRAIYSGGLRIWSAQDETLQAICDEEFQNEANFPEGVEYGLDYALSIQNADGAVTHYSSADLQSYVRENLDADFALLCATKEEGQAYADAFREFVLKEAGGDTADSSADNTGGANSGDTDGANGDSTDNANDSGTDNTNGSGTDSAGAADSTNVNGESTGSAQTVVLSERLTFSPQPQASLVLIEQETGFVRAIVGGRGEKTASLTLNRATDSLRQPGSTFKILTAYAPALDLCGQTLATLYENAPYIYEDGTPVSNWDITDYSGMVTIREAITRSVNVAAVRCLTEITPRVGFESAKRFGISTLVDGQDSEGGASDVIQPLALGGITRGVSNLELCAAYASIANGGMYGQPLFFTKILDRSGNVLIDCTERSATASENGSFGAFTRILQENTAFLLTSAMQDVVTSPEGTAYGVSAAGQPVAGKTGTTSNYKDIWFVGYTPYYTCCVWGGYDNNQNLPEGAAHSYSKTLWTAVMNRIHAALPVSEFAQPDTVEAVVLCSESLDLAREGVCPSVYTEYFAKGAAPTSLCAVHEPEPETDAETDIQPDTAIETETEPESGLIYQELLDQLLGETAGKDGEASGEATDEAGFGNETGAAKPGSEASTSAEGSEAESLTDVEDSEIDLSADTQDSGSNNASSSENEQDSSGSDASTQGKEYASSSSGEEESGQAETSEETSSLEDLLGRLNTQGFELY